MPKFFLHVCNGAGFMEDDEGTEAVDLAAALAAAVAGLRDILAGELRDDTLNTASFIEIKTSTASSSTRSLSRYRADHQRRAETASSEDKSINFGIVPL